MNSSEREGVAVTMKLNLRRAESRLVDTYLLSLVLASFSLARSRLRTSATYSSLHSNVVLSAVNLQTKVREDFKIMEILKILKTACRL